jgi:exopolysaccharide biosynthesis polyprenyl glycosylphosphotransferase
MDDFRPRARSGFKQDIRAPRRWGISYRLSWRWYRALVLVGTDIVALGSAWQLAHYLNQFFSPIPPELVWWNWFGLPSLFWVFAAVTLLLFGQQGLYNVSYKTRDYIKSAQLITLVYLASLVLTYFYNPKLDPPRSLFFTAWLSSLGLIIVARLVVNLLLRQIEQTYTQVNVFLIAPAQDLRRLSRIIQRRTNYHIAGAALASTANSPTTLQAIRSAKAQIVLAEALPDVDLASHLYWDLRRSGIMLQVLPSSREMFYRRGVPDVVAGLPTLRLDAPLINGVDYRLKRYLDYLGASLGLVVLSPLFLAIALAIRLDSPGPVFFRQERIGLHGQVFQVWKFRTMRADAHKLQAQLEAQNQSEDGVLFKIQQDPRITRVGQFLRRTSLDELPQLFNVLCNQMSLVGPRPLPLRDVAQFDDWHHIRHQVLPGITGLWQISGRSDIENFDDAARLDLYYINNWSLNQDLDILIETVRIVLFGKGAY